MNFLLQERRLNYLILLFQINLLKYVKDLNLVITTYVHYMYKVMIFPLKWTERAWKEQIIPYFLGFEISHSTHCGKR